MKYADLPPALRAQVDAQLGQAPKAARTSQRQATADTTSAWRCETCGQRFTVISGPRGWENHEHPRIACILG